MSTVIFAILLMAAVGLLLGSIIGLAAKIFAVESNPKVDEILEFLPGANCGGCGKAGCSDFAKAVVAGEASPYGCPVCAADAVARIAAVLGVEAGTQEKKTAMVFCGGSNTNTKNNPLYNGVNDCRSAMLIAGGPKGCKYGCLGLASCARACPFDAIEMVDGLAVVHPEVCVACGKCVEACPRDLIKLIPASVDVHVFCSSPEKAPAKKKVCDVACIGCRKCVKAAEEEQMTVKGFLVEVNYENPPGADLIEKAGCPTNCLRSKAVIEKKEKEAA
jgi:Na+-translocating ferredoxin:NAD+ oxidoreductase RNF subunit RnfB